MRASILLAGALIAYSVRPEFIGWLLSTSDFNWWSLVLAVVVVWALLNDILETIDRVHNLND